VHLGYQKSLLLANIFFRTDISMEVVNKIELKKPTPALRERDIL